MQQQNAMMQPEHQQFRRMLKKHQQMIKFQTVIKLIYVNFKFHDQVICFEINFLGFNEKSLNLLFEKSKIMSVL